MGKNYELRHVHYYFSYFFTRDMFLVLFYMQFVAMLGEYLKVCKILHGASRLMDKRT